MTGRKVEIAADEGRAYMTGSYSMPSGLTKHAGAQTLVLMVHGFPGNREGHEGLYSQLDRLCNEYGMHSFSFDFRGCGQSEGLQDEFTLDQALKDLNLVVEWATTQMFQEIILIGEGLGAYLCLQAAAAHPMVKMMILFWPVVDLGLYARQVFNAEELLANAGTEDYAEIGGHKVSFTLMREMMALGLPTPPDLTIPVLVQYGGQDPLIPPEHHIEKLKELLNARRLDITGYQDGNHGLTATKHRKMIFFHIRQFIEKFA